MDLTDIGFKHVLVAFTIIIFFLFTWLIVSAFIPKEVNSITDTPTTTTIHPKTQENETGSEIENRSKQNQTDNIVFVYHNVTNYINVTTYINETVELKLNVSEIQKDYIMNLKADNCYSSACSDGFFKCKNDVLDILDWKKSRYRETAKTGIMELVKGSKVNDSIACFNVEHKVYGDYVTFKNDYWRLVNEYNETLFNNIFVKLNVTEFNSTDEMKNFIFNEVLNSSLYSSDNYMLRRIEK